MVGVGGPVSELLLSAAPFRELGFRITHLDNLQGMARAKVRAGQVCC